jgi:hypothetical protein
MDDLINTTPLERYALMLQERIDQLEDNMLAWERTMAKQLQQTSLRHFKITLREDMDEGIGLRAACLQRIDAIMTCRAEFQPLFAWWTWDVYKYDLDEQNAQECLLVTVYMRLEFPICDEMFAKLIRESVRTHFPRATLSITNIEDYGEFRHALKVLKRTRTPEDSEIWTFVGDITGLAVCPIMKKSTFSTSENYVADEHLQTIFWSLIESKEWDMLLFIA